MATLVVRYIFFIIFIIFNIFYYYIVKRQPNPIATLECAPYDICLVIFNYRWSSRPCTAAFALHSEPSEPWSHWLRVASAAPLSPPRSR